MSTDPYEGPIVLPDDPTFGPEVQVDYPGLPLDALARPRAPARPAARGVPRPRRARLRRPCARAPRLGPDAAARGRAARRADHRARPHDRRGRPADPRRARRGVAGECRRPVQACSRRPPCAARPELLRRRPLPHRRRGPLPLRDRQARRLPVGEPRERLAAGTHPLLALRPAFHRAARDADVLPGRPALSPTTRSSTRCATRSSRALLVSRFDIEETQPEWALAYEWDIVLGRGGRDTTPIEEQQ